MFRPLVSYQYSVGITLRKEDLMHIVQRTNEMQLWQHCLLVTTCFGRPLRPSSGVLKTVLTATGSCHGFG